MMFARCIAGMFARGVCRAGFMLAWMLGASAVLAAPAVPVAAASTAPMNVVASFSILGDMVRVIGGDRIALTTIIGPDGDSHSFEPAPKDARALSGARVLFVNGLSFETWLPRLVKASGFTGLLAVASSGVTPLHLNPGEPATGGHHHEHHSDDGPAAHDHGMLDPHAWQSLANGMIYASNIAAGLAQADPAHASGYQLRANAYIARMKALDSKIKAELAAIPAQRRKVVTSHDAFGYFGQAYGIQFIAAAGLSNQAEPSAGEVAGIIDQVRQEHVPAVFFENITNSKLVKRIAAETGAKIGGTLYSDALAQPGEPAGTYLGMFEWNARQLIQALR